MTNITNNLTTEVTAPITSWITEADLSEYNFYCDMDSRRPPLEKISGQPLQTSVLASGRVSYEGGPYGVNSPAVDSKGLFGCGAFEQLITYTSDKDFWSTGSAVTLSDSTLAPPIQTIENNPVKYNISELTARNLQTSFVYSAYSIGDIVTGIFYVYPIVDTQIFVRFRGGTDQDFSDTFIVQAGSWQKIVLSGALTRDHTSLRLDLFDISGGLGDRFYITGFQLWESSYVLPYIENNTGSIIVIPENYSDAGQGYKFPIAEMPQLRDALDGVADGVELVANNDPNVASVVDENNYAEYNPTTGIGRIVSDGTWIKMGWNVLGGGYYELVYEELENNGGSISITNETISVGVPLTNGSEVVRFINNGTSENFLLGRTTGGCDVTFRVSVKEISPAKGKLSCKWRPMFDSGDLMGNLNILTANDEAESFLFFDADNDLLKLTDGTNTSQVACYPVADTEYEITGQWDSTNGMVISLDESTGTTVSFAGSIPNADDLSYSWDAEAPQYVKLSYIEKESGL
jgi:hypothetical protein